jgi:hypothetical protein
VNKINSDKSTGENSIISRKTEVKNEDDTMKEVVVKSDEKEKQCKSAASGAFADDKVSGAY